MKMLNLEKYTETLRCHHGIEYFDYNPVIDWAIELIKNGIESENVLILASFSKPVDREEIKPYVTAALKELNLTEKYTAYSVDASVHYYIEQILNDCEIRKNLCLLHTLYIESNNKDSLNAFYLLYECWGDLEQTGENYYFEGVDLDNIEEALKTEAQIWMDNYLSEKAPKKQKRFWQRPS